MKIIRIETIQEAKKRLFGIKKDPAKVKVWYEVKDKPAAPEKNGGASWSC